MAAENADHPRAAGWRRVFGDGAEEIRGSLPDHTPALVLIAPAETFDHPEASSCFGILFPGSSGELLGVRAYLPGREAAQMARFWVRDALVWLTGLQTTAHQPAPLPAPECLAAELAASWPDHHRPDRSDPRVRVWETDLPSEMEEVATLRIADCRGRADSPTAPLGWSFRIESSQMLTSLRIEGFDDLDRILAAALRCRWQAYRSSG